MEGPYRRIQAVERIWVVVSILTPPSGIWLLELLHYMRNWNGTKRMSMDVNGDGFLDVIW
ncbi:hypothetical protein S1OALGB6SA_1042, partial [Olavius algarvensis spirochete endosymbiont]